MGTTSAAPRAVARRRSRYSRRLLGAAVMVLLGAFLPWVYTGAGTVVGVRGAGLWTMYVAVLGLAGALLRSSRLAAAHAGVLGVVAVVLPLWQLVHLLSKVGTAGWMPGVGLVLTLGGGVLACTAAVGMLREAGPDSA